MKSEYTYQKLKVICDEHNVVLNTDYKKLALNPKTLIEGECINEKCNENFRRPFRHVVKHESFTCRKCNTCAKNGHVEKLLKYGEENNITFLEDYEGMRIISDTIIKGYCSMENCTEHFEKSFKSLLEYGSRCNKCTIQEGRTKAKSLCHKKNLETFKQITEGLNITFLEDYENMEIINVTRIKGICLTENCGEQFDKSFVSFRASGAYCLECANENGRFKKDMILNDKSFIRLKQLADEQGIIFTENYKDVSINNDSIIQGICLTEECGSHFEKKFETLFTT